MSDIFLKAYHGGLGDNLQFSTLPEEFAKQQNRKTYIDDSASFRNPEIYDLVWKCNPYVLGKKQGEWNAGDLPTISYTNSTNNTISNWEQCHGLAPTNKYPKIYYTPKHRDEFANTFIVDLSSITIPYDQEQLNRIVDQLQATYSTKIFKSISFSCQINNEGHHNKYNISNITPCMINDIFEYCDVVSSSYGFIGLSSGSSHLSSALKAQYAKDLISICIMPKFWHDEHKRKGLFLFDNIEYITY